MTMFEVGDAVVHPEKGAGIIQSLRRMLAMGKKLYYKIQIVNHKTKTTLMVPVKGAEKLGLRPAIPEDDLDKVWETLSASPQALPDVHKQRYKLLNNNLSQGTILSTAEVVRDLAWRREQTGRLNVPGQRIYDKAIQLLASELAVSQEIQLESAKRQIRRELQKGFTAKA